jgi:UDP-N-acetylmuramoylalanine-D-glutamate ligase
LRAAGVKLELGGFVPQTFLEQDLIVVSPGVPAKIEPLENARARGIPVWSEIELAWRFLRGKLVAITGSNGKTTTTSLVAHILKTPKFPRLMAAISARRCFRWSNTPTDLTVTVAEVSSFQLERIEAFRPDVGVLLNLTPDHLDRHASFEEYARAKMRMFENQLERDAAVLNADDPEVTQAHAGSRNLTGSAARSAWLRARFCEDRQIVFRHYGDEKFLWRGSHEIQLARRAQRRKRFGRLRRSLSCRSRSGADRRRREKFSWRRAQAGIRGRNRRRAVFTTIPRRRTWTRRARPSKLFPGRLHRHSGRQGQGQSVRSACASRCSSGARDLRF